MAVIREKPHRKTLQLFLAPLVPLVIVGGFFFPYLGFVALAMMILMLVMAIFRSRLYCGWICAMGAFHERILARVSLKKEMPALFKKNWFRWLFFAGLMSLMIFRLASSGGDPARVGAVFVMMWTVATTLAVGFGLYFKPRSWCNFCPMGTMQGYLTPNTYLLQVSSECKECGFCRKVCPVQTYPGEHKEQGFVPSQECMRCGNCIVNCPKKALSLPPIPVITQRDLAVSFSGNQPAKSRVNQ
jgi:ferredoxin-type protein NapH